MEIAIVTINRVFKSYQGQARIAELNNMNPVKRIQGQRDRVSISDGARAALKAHGAGQSPVRTEEVQFVQTEEVEVEKNGENVPSAV